jgi:hypothetical protein
MRKAVGGTATIMLIFLVELSILVNVADCNPTWGKPATPIPPIKDPPEVTIVSPSSTVYNDPVSLKITIVQPDSWISQTPWQLPNGYVDNSNSSNTVVVGQNKLSSVTCIIDGQSIVLWNGTPLGFNAVTYYLPRVTEFSATMNLSKGQHNLQVNVLAVSEYVTEGIIPFAQKEYNISVNQSTTFRSEDDSDAPMIYDIKSSYVIWQLSSASMPSPTLAPPQSLSTHQDPTTNPSVTPTAGSSHSPTVTTNPTQTEDPTSSPKVPEFPSTLSIAFLISALLLGAIMLKRKKALGGNH